MVYCRESLTWLDNLARWVFNKQLTTIQVCDSNLKPTKSLNQPNTLDHVKVTAIPAEFLKIKNPSLLIIFIKTHSSEHRIAYNGESLILIISRSYLAICVLTCEVLVNYLMFFLLQHQNYVSWFHAWCLISFPRERDLLSMFHAFVHMYLQKLSLFGHLMTLTLFATVLLIYHFTYTNTIITIM